MCLLQLMPLASDRGGGCNGIHLFQIMPCLFQLMPLIIDKGGVFDKWGSWGW